MEADSNNMNEDLKGVSEEDKNILEWIKQFDIDAVKLKSDGKIQKIEIPLIFKNGFYFGKILNSFGRIEKFADFKDTDTPEDINNNYKLLKEPFNKLNFNYTETEETELKNGKEGTAQQILLKIKYLLKGEDELKEEERIKKWLIQIGINLEDLEKQKVIRIAEISSTFRNGYYFGKVLYNCKLIKNFYDYRDSENPPEINKNFGVLTKTLNKLGIKFNFRDKEDILKEKSGSALQVLSSIEYLLNSDEMTKEEQKIKDWLKEIGLDLNELKKNGKIKTTSIAEVFRNGYYFGNVLHIHKQIPNFFNYKDTDKKEDIAKNYIFLTKAFADLGVKFSERERILILSKKEGIAMQILLSIRQQVDKKLLCKDTLKAKTEKEISKIYFKYQFANENEKYYRDFKNKQALKGKVKLTPIQKFGQKVSPYYQDIIKKIHDDELYVADQRKMKYNKIRNMETKKAEEVRKKDEENLKNWQHSMQVREGFENYKIEDAYKNVRFYQTAVLENFKRSAGLVIEKNESKENGELIPAEEAKYSVVERFKENLSRLGLDIQDEALKKKMLSKAENASSEIIMRRYQDKVKQIEKMRKDKQKRDRKIKSQQQSLPLVANKK